MRKSTTVPLLALCLAGVLTSARAASTTPSVPKPMADTVKPADKAKVVASDTAKALAADTAKAAAGGDSARAASADSAEAPASLPAAAVSDSAADADSAQAKSKPKKRKRVVRETTVNTIDELKGKYRSPKKALFMSLVVPGLGQAYVGQNWFNYTRGAAYFAADVALIFGWHHYVVTRQDAQIGKYKAFADSNWRQSKYEDSIAKHIDGFQVRNQERESYCDAVQDRSTASGNALWDLCTTPKEENQSFQQEYNDGSWSLDSIAHRRAQFPNPQAFYELIGKGQEFITGWNDANRVYVGDSSYYEMDAEGNPAKDNQDRFILATTPNQQAYIGMRAKANEYARMQAYFLGGMVLNHIVSAIDAALTAHYHNKSLYQTETSWYDRVSLYSRVAWDGFAPVPTITAHYTF